MKRQNSGALNGIEETHDDLSRKLMHQLGIRNGSKSNDKVKAQTQRRGEDSLPTIEESLDLWNGIMGCVRDPGKEINYVNVTTQNMEEIKKGDQKLLRLGEKLGQPSKGPISAPKGLGELMGLDGKKKFYQDPLLNYPEPSNQESRCGDKQRTQFW